MTTQNPSLARNVRDFWQSAASSASLIAFLTFVTIGVVFIVFAKLAFVPNRYLTLVPVVIMVAYAGVALGVRSIRLRDDQTGDNLYYMGFIFTLTSLAVALYQFEPDVGFDAIVRNFGVAISSTITGIALRVLFNQMRRDPIEVEYAARQELAEAARQVRQQLNDTVLAFNHFRTQTIQSLEEVQEELRKKMLSESEAVAEKAAASIERAAAKTGEALDTFTSGMTETLQRTVGQLGDESSKIARAIAGIEAAFASLNERLATMLTPDRIIEIKLEPVVAALTSAVTEFSRQNQVQLAALTRVAADLAGVSPVKPRSRWHFWRR